MLRQDYDRTQGRGDLVHYVGNKMFIVLSNQPWRVLNKKRSELLRMKGYNRDNLKLKYTFYEK